MRHNPKEAPKSGCCPPPRVGYTPPRITANRHIAPHHVEELSSSTIDFVTAGLAGVSTVSHGEAHDMGIRGRESLDGLAYRYWDPSSCSFSRRFFRVKPDAHVAGRKYLQPVGEKPKLYFIPGTSIEDLQDTSVPVYVTEGEKKALSLERALGRLGRLGVVIGIGGVWSWRWSPKEEQPDGKLGKGKSRPVNDLDLVHWKGRAVYVFFDSDVSTNWKVCVAETALAKELARRGAKVFLPRIRGDQ